jgi:hypothetical protein
MYYDKWFQKDPHFPSFLMNNLTNIHHLPTPLFDTADPKPSHLGSGLGFWPPTPSLALCSQTQHWWWQQQWQQQELLLQQERWPQEQQQERKEQQEQQQ